nr:MAG TPA: hypothetical protein [Caudoviricetes sp.]
MAKTITLTNIMAYEGKGFFPASLNNCTWQGSTQTPGDGATESVRVIPSAAGECTLTSAKHSLIASHKYYLSFKIKFESQVSGTVDWYWPVAEPAAVSGMKVSGDANTWIRCSAVFDRTSFSDGDYPCRFDYNNESVNVPFRFTSCMMFDLTAAFGAGKEPSKEWMDNYVTAYADSQTVNHVENLGELFTDIANAIRSKSGTSGQIFACEFADRIRKL